MILSFILGIIVFIIGLLLNNYNVLHKGPPSIVFALMVLLAILTATAIGRQPVQEIELSFKVRTKSLYRDTYLRSN